MKSATLTAGLLLAALSLSSPTQAQGVPGGAAHGAAVGANAAGPVGAVVGTVVGGAIGGVEGVLGIDHRGYYAQPYAVAAAPVYRAPRRIRLSSRYDRRHGYARPFRHSHRVRHLRYRHT